MSERNVLILTKDEEKYVLIFEDDDMLVALGRVMRWATDPELSFDLWDACLFSKRIIEYYQLKESDLEM